MEGSGDGDGKRKKEKAVAGERLYCERRRRGCPASRRDEGKANYSAAAKTALSLSSSCSSGFLLIVGCLCWFSVTMKPNESSQSSRA